MLVKDLNYTTNYNCGKINYNSNIRPKTLKNISILATSASMPNASKKILK